MPEVAKKYEETFPKVNLFTIDEVFGGWRKAQKKHFEDKGIVRRDLHASEQRCRHCCRRGGASCDLRLDRRKTKRHPSVIPGFGITLGLTLTWLALIVLIPLGGLFLKTAELTLGQFWAIVTSRRVLHALEISFGLSLGAAAINLVFGAADRLGAGALRVSRTAASSMRSSTFPSRCRPPSPVSR